MGSNMNTIQAVRAEILDFTADPATHGCAALRHYKDGILVIESGKILHLGNAQTLLPTLPPKTPVTHYKDHLIIPGMIDTHIHFPQTPMIAAHGGGQLLNWLDTCTFPTEERFSDTQYAERVAAFFIKELLRNGTTTAMVFGSVHPASVNAIFKHAMLHNMRIIAGKVMMDRHCPDALKDTPEQAYDDSKALIEQWHNRGRLMYAVTPRFAPSCSTEQLNIAGTLLAEYPDVYMQTHLSENTDECNWVKALFPEAKDYLDVYERANLLGRRSIFAHAIHISDDELKRLSESQSAIAHCPSSNLFIGSGLFDLKRCEQANVQIGMASDIGAGTSFSLFQNYNEAYKIQQLQGGTLSPLKGLYLNTLGGARALHLEGIVGNFNLGCEADFIVLNKSATPLIKLRLKHSHEIEDTLFALMMLGDDRCVSKTYVMGKAVYDKSSDNNKY